MRITVGHLRRIIREALLEAGGAPPTPPRPVTADPAAPIGVGREQLGRISIRDMDVDDIAPHLRADAPQEDDDPWGPVPPLTPEPHVGPDPYVRDYGVLPTPQIKR